VLVQGLLSFFGEPLPSDNPTLVHVWHCNFEPRSTVSFMFSRVSQIARHLSRPAAQFAYSSTTAAVTAGTRPQINMSTAERNFARTIHTAACLIIGDEVLGGKACFILIDPDWAVRLWPSS
jgi:hypothetical protein